MLFTIFFPFFFFYFNCSCLLPITCYDNLNVSFVNLSQVLKGLCGLFLLTVFRVLFASMEMSFKPFWQKKSSCFQLKFELLKITFSDTRLVLRLCMRTRDVALF